MKLNIKYFAALRERAGKSHEIHETVCRDPLSLLQELNNKYAFNIDQKHLKVSINRQYTDWTATFSDGDEVVFIPPVAGG